MSKYEWQINNGDDDFGEWEEIEATTFSEAVEIATELLREFAQSMREDECADETWGGYVVEYDDEGEWVQEDGISVTLPAEEPECEDDRPHKWGEEDAQSIMDYAHQPTRPAMLYERVCRRCGVMERRIVGQYDEWVRYLSREEQQDEEERREQEEREEKEEREKKQKQEREERERLELERKERLERERYLERERRLAPLRAVREKYLDEMQAAGRRYSAAQQAAAAAFAAATGCTTRLERRNLKRTLPHDHPACVARRDTLIAAEQEYQNAVLAAKKRYQAEYDKAIAAMEATARTVTGEPR